MIKVAAIADIHFREDSVDTLRPWFEPLHDEADVLLLGGDLTGVGLLEQGRLLARELRGLTIPVFAVLGNHDYHHHREREIAAILTENGVHVLDGEARTIQVRDQSVAVVGVKGFAGGFGKGVLMPFGEETLKRFVLEADREVQKLDRALAAVYKADFKLVVMHYSPIRETLRGELPEIYPFLGCSKFCDPINRWTVDLVVHGHAHRGSEKGSLHSGIPVRNVSLPVLKRYYATYEV
jgi:Icc-related predicted phosphoesterase